MSNKLPGKGLLGWLGRQVGYVRSAVKAEPVGGIPAKRSAPQSPGPKRTQSDAAPAPGEKPVGGVLYRHDQVQEAEHPSQPGVKLRRTIIDEVIVDRDKPAGAS